MIHWCYLSLSFRIHHLEHLHLCSVLLWGALPLPTSIHFPSLRSQSANLNSLLRTAKSNAKHQIVRCSFEVSTL
ncbi:hypothetical protein BT96DRAFT_718546 [Gymnopus androsaceus JB14]|uniref:Uncharacterized protein n=1 Tax=Gymnopus androsaceus JB14 TaxID=1447944 RepID=A0A6A4GE75_9AGAR|nr:hypothetical protein BT96DRAFT_718546 [Gymnopus androsaceus JB14]